MAGSRRPGPGWSAAALAAVVVIGAAAVRPAVRAATTAGAPPFLDVAEASELRFRHYKGWTGKRFIVEITGSGGGLLDYDGDGDLDVLLLDGAPLPGSAPTRELPRTRLFRNDGTGHFADVTASSGLGHRAFAMGVAAGDIDNDGDPDLLVTGYGPDALYRNGGDGTFEDVTAWAGVADTRWTTSAVFFDYDNDGDLDLYVTAYLDFDPARHRPCTIRGHEVYCGPQQYGGLPDRLYRNDGTGRFSDVSAAAGIAEHMGKGLGVVAGDIDGDGDQDLYVANDGTANFVFVNHLDQGRAVFTEEGLTRGAAYGEDARAEAGMGVDMGDFDDDGDPDVVVTNLDEQTHSLYRNDESFFMESSYSRGLGALSLPWVGFGVRFLDYDLDADLDLVVTNGHIMDNVGLVRQGALFAQHNTLFENEAGRFREPCPDCLPKGVGRGLATGDVDGDGDEDVLVTNSDGPPYLLENVAPKKGAAIGLRLEGSPRKANRDAYGARVSWEAWGARRVREVRAGASYCSTSDPRLLLAVPQGTARARVTVRWPGGSEESFELAPGAYHHVVQGQGVRASVPFRRSR